MNPLADIYHSARRGGRAVLIGYGESEFNLHHEEHAWVRVNKVIDNGPQRLYSAYYGDYYIGDGLLVVWDEIDKEYDLLEGGAIPDGWVTNFPRLYATPPKSYIDEYWRRKYQFRGTFLDLVGPHNPESEAFTRSTTGQEIYRLAVLNPQEAFGSVNQDRDPKGPFTLGVNGKSPRFPTITTNYYYYRAKYPLHRSLFDPSLRIASLEARPEHQPGSSHQQQ
ncbi:hypothetical protein F4802DRAFT_615522 [Xylaria palmicola]|nr:hypothetical protein F4802DRAFT_615522 [Xylaria palmicola]